MCSQWAAVLAVVFEASEALGAGGAAEAVVIGVRALVLQHVCTPTEALLTELALKWLDACTHKFPASGILSALCRSHVESQQ